MCCGGMGSLGGTITKKEIVIQAGLPSFKVGLGGGGLDGFVE